MRQTTRPLTSLVEKLNSQMLRKKSSLLCENDLNSGHQWLLRSFPSCRCHVAALLTLKANIWLDTLTVKQWEIMINSDLLLFFWDQWGNYLWAALTLLLLWLFDWPPPNHISYISKPNNALILLFLLNITIIIIIIFLSNPKPFSKFLWYPELLFLVFIQLLYLPTPVQLTWWWW